MSYDYVPLHVHTCFSGDGLGKVHDLLQYANELKFKAISITDHATLAGAVQFWDAAKEYGIKPIFGNEIYLEWNGKRGHLTVLSSGLTGFNNLIALNNAAHENVARGFPVTTVEMLSKYNDGLLVLTGCSASPLYHGDEADALKFAGTLFDIFGVERMFAETMGVISEDNVTRPKWIAKRLGINTVVTTDTHFARPEQAGAHPITTTCRKGFDYSSSELYLKSGKELIETNFLRTFADEQEIKGYMSNTLEIADSIEAIDLSAPPSLPHIEQKGVTLFDTAIRLAGLPEYKARVEEEIRVIEGLELYDYFAILYDIVEFCKANGIKVGPGRGSGGGSLFLYLLGITDIDPIQHGLLFERFLSATRKDMADFDLDIEANRRDEVIEYARTKWGAFPIANFATYSRPSLVRDIGRVFKVPMEIVENAADSEDDDTLEEFFAYCLQASTSSGKRVTEKDARVAYKTMLGQVRHKGKHAGGVVICTRPVPVEGGIVSWTEGVNRELSKVGLVKYDILGVTALSMLSEMERLTGVQANEPWDADSEPVFDLFCKADLQGIFQFSGSDGIVQLTKQVQPRSLADLSAINALYRPGPLDSGMAWEYPKAKLQPRLVQPEVDAILKDSYGIIIYQEQVMQIVALMTGGSLSDADDARKIISKGKVNDPKWQAKMRDLEAHFKTEGYKHFAKQIVDMLWSEIVTFGRYGFNKSHSTAYSLLAYRMAWFKVYYPGAFYTALLNNDAEKAETWAYDAAAHGITIMKPHVNTSGVLWVWDEAASAIFAPLSSIKFFGEDGAQAIVDWREQHGEFNTFKDIAKVPKRVLNIRAKKLMYYAEAFRGIGGDVKDIIPEFDSLPILKSIEAQRESMGFILPNREILDFLKRSEVDGRIAGFVTEIEKRNKGKGDYYVVKLSPSGVFWTRECDKIAKIKEGDLISVRMGKVGATEFKRARL